MSRFFCKILFASFFLFRHCHYVLHILSHRHYTPFKNQLFDNFEIIWERNGYILHVRIWKFLLEFSSFAWRDIDSINSILKIYRDVIGINRKLSDELLLRELINLSEKCSILQKGSNAYIKHDRTLACKYVSLISFAS